MPQEKWIPKGVPGQEKSEDLVNSVFHRHHGRRGVEGGAPPSETRRSIKDLTGWWHGHEVTVSSGQSHMAVTHNMPHIYNIKKRFRPRGKKKMVKNVFVVLTPNQINVFLMKMKTRAETCWMISGVPLPFSLFIICSRITAMQTSDLKTCWA